MKELKINQCERKTGKILSLEDSKKENETETEGKIRDPLIKTNILARREYWKLRTGDG